MFEESDDGKNVSFSSQLFSCENLFCLGILFFALRFFNERIFSLFYDARNFFLFRFHFKFDPTFFLVIDGVWVSAFEFFFFVFLCFTSKVWMFYKLSVCHDWLRMLIILRNHRKCLRTCLKKSYQEKWTFSKKTWARRWVMILRNCKLSPTPTNPLSKRFIHSSPSINLQLIFFNTNKDGPSVCVGAKKKSYEWKKRNVNI